jgi:NAD(P)H-dependent FMN reductase
MKLAVIIGSTREGRATDKLAAWVAKGTSEMAEVEVSLRSVSLFLVTAQ